MTKKIFNHLIHALVGGSHLDAAKASPIAREFAIDFTAGDNPKVKDVIAAEILDDSIMRELDESGFVQYLGLN